MINTFIEFLKDNNLYDMYMSNMPKSDIETYGDIESILDSRISNPEDYIISPFIWRDTPQGREFWFNIDNLWTNTINNQAYETDI